MKSHFGKLKEIKNKILGITFKIALIILLKNPSQVEDVLTIALMATSESSGAVTKLVGANPVATENMVDSVMEDIR